MSDILEEPHFRPPAPKPRTEPLGTVAFLRAVRENPLSMWMQDHFIEPVITGDGALGRLTVVSDPAMIRHILLDNAANYRKDDLQIRILAPGLGRGLVTAEGDAWRLQRRTIAPLFTPRNVAGFFPAMVGAAERLVHRWQRRPEGRVVDVSLEMTRVTLDVLERTIFTHGVPKDPDALGRAITRYFNSIGRIDPLDIFGFPDWIPRVGRIRARPSIQFFEETVNELIEARKALLASGEPAPRDLLTLLLEAADPETSKGLSDVEVRTNIVTFIGAGHETTANALSWSLYLLSQDERARTHVEREVDDVLGAGPFEPRHLEKLVYTRAVIDEAIRLYPPAPYMSRTAIEDDMIGDLAIPAGSMVAIAPYVLHRHRRLWDDPDAFRPERFLPEERGRIDRFAYLPFGAGPRVCIGASFALQEAVIVLATIARTIRLDLLEGHVVEPVQRITLRPRGGLPMHVRMRADEAAGLTRR
ncbi:cytochrome P450 [Microvirga flocculans]|uniref:Cytochrome P450 n=1 Tax=Microvirga flocculans TaxID=217168 RepID=A0A7W6ID80_9HYPH|nr:cytochrome P450 [Microvirga flocculans]MBB4039320.1 cytochrome P450 [Microvirga flocculans]